MNIHKVYSLQLVLMNWVISISWWIHYADVSTNCLLSLCKAPVQLFFGVVKCSVPEVCEGNVNGGIGQDMVNAAVAT